jgi:hypothetical protein
MRYDKKNTLYYLSLGRISFSLPLALEYKESSCIQSWYHIRHMYSWSCLLMRECFNDLCNSDLLYSLQFVNQFGITPSSDDAVKVYMFWQKSETLYSGVCNGIQSVADELAMHTSNTFILKSNFQAIILYLPLLSSL